LTSWKRALVTGSSSGIGAAFARQLASQGTDLVLVARREDRLRALAAEVEGASVEILVADLVQSEDRQRVEERLEAEDEPIDLLVNNAGGHHRIAPLIEHGRDSLTDEVILNAVTALRLTHAAAQSMARRGTGTILQVSSATAFGPGPNQAAYVASKAFVNSLSESLRHELRRSGVSVTVVAPGFTRTEAPAALGFNDDNVPRLLWQNADDVARYALRKAARSRRTIYTSGLLNKVLGRLSYLGPRPVVARVTASVMEPAKTTRP
jgi:short-subunit dehydrogenase